jgi:hypothetical protein
MGVKNEVEMLEEAELARIPHLIGRRKATPQLQHKLAGFLPRRLHQQQHNTTPLKTF